MIARTAVATADGYAYTVTFNASTAKPSLKGAAEMDKIKTEKEAGEIEDLHMDLGVVEEALGHLAGDAEKFRAKEIHKWANDALEMVMTFETETRKLLEEYEER